MRLMMTPGPSSIDPRVYRALAAPVVGHIDPWFKTCMDETQILMRQIFQTENRVTMPLSASGSGGIEASVLNALEEGDEAIICVNGWFSERMYEIALRTPAKITKVEAPYGKAVDAEDVRKAGTGTENQDCRLGARRDFFGSGNAARSVSQGCRRTWRIADRGHGGIAGSRTARTSTSNDWTLCSAGRRKRSARRRACRRLR